jgi:carboxyl-terminal processing protease
MKVNNIQRKYLFVVGIIILCGTALFAVSKADIFKQVAVNQKLINDVYKYIVTNYADEIDVEKFTRKSIRNILNDLDPFTVFMEPEEGEGIDLLTKGKYGGVGMEIGKRDGEITVVAPMADSPTMRAGIISGDVIVKIDTVVAKDMNLNDVARLIRGEKGTEVTLSIQRAGVDNVIKFTMIREDIKVKDVAYSGMLNDRIGYILLTRFSKNAAPGMKKAIDQLKEQKAEAIILDLRNNPGGLLKSSIDILDMFLLKGEKLLSTKGRTKGSNRTFFSKKDPVIGSDIKIAILINEGSASASEIVSGAIQDLDRGVIIGRRSFGKGLVQSVYQLDKERRLKMTTAKYYIPSGRLIQNPGYIDKDIINDVSEQDTLFATVKGRKVKGGGGIMPDYEVEVHKYGPLTRECWRQGILFTYVQKRKQNYSSFDEVLATEDLIEDFYVYLKEQDLDISIDGESNYNDFKAKLSSIDSTNAELNSAFEIIDGFFVEKEASLFDKESEDIRKWLLAEFANHYNGKEGRIQFTLQSDEYVEKAISILEDQVAYRNVLRLENE